MARIDIQSTYLLAVLVIVFSFVSPSLATDGLLGNPSFEILGSSAEPPPGWQLVAGVMGEEIWVDADASGTGSKALVMDTGGRRSAGLRSDPITALPGEVYEATVRVLADAGSEPLLRIDYLDANQQRLAHKAIAASSSGRWETLRVSHTAPAGTEWVSILLYADAASSPGTVRFDQATLDEVTPYSLTVSTDRPNALYNLDEPVTFVVSVAKAGKPATGVTVEWRLSNDGLVPLRSGQAQVVDGEARVIGHLDQPGFMRVEATVRNSQGSTTVTAAAGIAPQQIEPSMPAPDDFDQFWSEKKAALAEVPVSARLTPVNSSVAGIEIFDVRVESLGAPVSGYMARPASAQAGSLPAIITLHGAGVGSASLGTATNWAREGILALDINAHGIDNGQPADYYKQLENGVLHNYWFLGRESRDTYYYLEMFLRVVRAIDFVTSQPEWDGKTLILYGTSQGGAQSLAGAGLDDRVTFFVAGVTGMADVMGTFGRPTGYQSRADFLRMPSVQAQRIYSTLPYFDVANFAARSKADGFFTVGFLDNQCRPTAVYAAYNMLRGEKAIYNDLFAGHTNTPEATRLMRAAVLGHIAKQKTMANS